MPAKKATPPEEEKKKGTPVKRTATKKPVTKKPAAKKPAPKKATPKKTAPKKPTPKAAEAKNDNPPADQKKPRPRSPRNGVELPEGRPFEPGEQARELGRKGGVKSAAVKKARKTLREELLDLLQVTTKDSDGKEHTQQELILLRMIKEATLGRNAVKAAEYIRDTIGEKVAEKTEVTVALPKFESLDDAFAKMSGDAP